MGQAPILRRRVNELCALSYRVGRGSEFFPCQVEGVPRVGFRRHFGSGLSYSNVVTFTYNLHATRSPCGRTREQ